VTVPLHDPMKAGTLHGIVSEVSLMRPMALEDILKLL
jgi:hypothetical protein